MRSIYAVACSAMVMLSAFTACSNDDSYELTPEQIAYIEKNIEYIREKKQEKNENGELVYQQLVKYGDTTLYRVIDRKSETPKYPTGDQVLTYDLEGFLIDGTNFQKKGVIKYPANGLIEGLRGVILDTSIGDSIEAIIPASLGYKFKPVPDIPIGSTLIFNYRASE